MDKVIPKFYIPKKFSNERKIIATAIVKSQCEVLGVAIKYLRSNLMVYEGQKITEKPKSKSVIENYLRGFYAVDLMKLDGKLYSEADPHLRLTDKNLVKISAKAKVEVIKPLESLVDLDDALFEEKFLQLVAQSSELFKSYVLDISAFSRDEYKKLSKEKQIELLRGRCNYTEVSEEGLRALNIFLEDKTYIDNYLALFNFIKTNYEYTSQDNLGLIPIGLIINDLKSKSNYKEEEFKKFLMQLKYTNRIALKTTKNQLAKSGDLELVDIHGMKYGFVKLLNSSELEV